MLAAHHTDGVGLVPRIAAGVGQHDHVVLGAAEGLHPLAVRGAGLVDVAGDRRGADEADRLDVRVREQRVHRHLVAVHHVEHAVGQPGLAPTARPAAARPTGPSPRLEHERVAAGDREREHPHRHHGREVERGDARRPRRAAAGSSRRPRRWRRSRENPPLSRCGMPQANSTTSRPRATSPAASRATLPCSAVISGASLRGARRPARGTRTAPGRAWPARCPASRGARRFAAATAASTSAGEAKSTCPLTSPVAGS